MAEIKILVEGYAKKLPTGWVASSTACLVTTDAGLKIITDPGCNRAKLISALTDAGLPTADIDYVFLSHQHPDHILLAGIFENAKAITYDDQLLYDGDHLSQYDSLLLGPDIEIVQTPGHTLEHISLLVDTEEGKVAIASDTIWWLDDDQQTFRLDQPDHSEAKGMDMATLIESRRKLIAAADYIIPGHGKKFKVQK